MNGVETIDVLRWKRLYALDTEEMSERGKVGSRLRIDDLKAELKAFTVSLTKRNMHVLTNERDKENRNTPKGVVLKRLGTEYSKYVAEKISPRMWSDAFPSDRKL